MFALARCCSGLREQLFRFADDITISGKLFNTFPESNVHSALCDGKGPFSISHTPSRPINRAQNDSALPCRLAGYYHCFTAAIRRVVAEAECAAPPEMLPADSVDGPEVPVTLHIHRSPFIHLVWQKQGAFFTQRATMPQAQPSRGHVSSGRSQMQKKKKWARQQIIEL